MQIRGTVLFLLLSVAAFAQGGFYQDRAEGRLINGNALVAIPGAAVTVCSDQACVSPVNIYSNADLAVGHLIGTSTTADANGNFSFYVLPGQYFCQVAASGFSTAINPCQVSMVPPLLSLTLGTVGSPPVLSEDVAACCTNFLNVSQGLHLHNTLAIDGGTFELGTGVGAIPTGMVYQDGGFNIVVQPAPRGKEAFPITSVSITSNAITVNGSQLETFSPGDVVFLSGLTESFLNGQIVTVATSNGTNSFTANFTHADFSNPTESRGLAETNFIKANSTEVLPDLALGTTTDNSGFLAGILATQPTQHCMFYGGFGVLQDSGFTCNVNLQFPDLTHSVVWVNGANTMIFKPTALTGTRNLVLPDASGTLLATGNGISPIQTVRTTGCATTASAGATCDTTVTWSTAFADTSYTVTCGGNTTTSGVPVSGGVNTKAAGSIKFRTVALTAAAAQFTNVECIGVHD